MITAVGQHQIIHDPAIIICEESVPLAIFTQTLNVHGDQCFQCRRRHGVIRAPNNDLPHMADIEQARLSAGM